MKRLLPVLAFAACFGDGRVLYAQQTTDTPFHSIFRLYEDDDFINILGQGTDDAYTNGTRMDYFYIPRHRPKNWLTRIMPRAGDSSLDVYGWGAMQLMYTPDSLTDPHYQPNDYPWSGALLLTHTLYSYDPAKKYDLRTEYVAGVLGPAALTKETQTVVHSMIRYIRPQGWGHQFNDYPMLNVNFTAERQLAGLGHTVEIIGGARASAGTMQNSLALYPLIRIGWMRPYFNGFFSQYTSDGGAGHKRKWQLYFLVRPEWQLIGTDALLQGGPFTHNPNLKAGQRSAKTQADGSDDTPQPYHPISHSVECFNYGAVLTSGNFGISFNQNISSAMMKGLYCHDVGNISLYFAW